MPHRKSRTRDDREIWLRKKALTTDELVAENADLRRRLEEAEETLRAIRHGAVDAFVVQEPHRNRIYTLEGADRPYRILIERTQQGAAMLTADGTIAYGNLSLASLLKVSLQRLIGTPLHGFVPPAHQARYQTLLDDGRTSMSQGEIELERTDGVLVPVYVTFSTLSDTRSAIGLLVTDLTEQKQRSELAAAHELLKETNRLKDDFLMTLSHELRTPLHAIVGWSHVLREAALSSDAQRRAIDGVERNAKVQAQLIEDLLDVSRIVSRKLQIKTDTVDLGAVAKAALETVLLSAKAKRIDLTLTVTPDEQILVSGDVERLQQVVWNLLSNAIKFTPSDGRVDIEVRRDDETAVLLVRDTGRGIPNEVLRRVFHRFWQAEGTRTRRYGGLGLGLAIVRNITEAHGGTVTAESPGEGKGATFIVRLPIRVVDDQRSESRTAISPGPAATALTGASVLVVDDEPDARDVMSAILGRRGADVMTVSSAEEALRALNERSFNVLVCDIGMPGRDGYALIQAVRALPADQGGQLPAIAVTAYASPRDRNAVIDAGYNWHLAKPIDPQQVVALVSTAIKSAVSAPSVGPDEDGSAQL